MTLGAPLSAREPRYTNAAGRRERAGPFHLLPGGAGVTTRPANPLLVKDDVGKAKPSCYDVPGVHFAFGKPCLADPEGAREVSLRWVGHTPTAGRDANAPDFVVLNKRALAAKITTAKDLKYYAKEYPARAAPRRGPLKPANERVKAEIESLLPPDFTHGRKVRSSTPIGEVITNRFGEHAEKELYDFYTAFRELKETAGAQVRKVPLTAASRGHASRAKKMMREEDMKAPYKLARFKHVASRVDTRRLRSTEAVPVKHRWSADGAEESMLSTSDRIDLGRETHKLAHSV